MEYKARIKHIVIYPVKSCGRIEAQQATLTPAGLVVGNYADHQFMAVSDSADFIEANKKKPYKEGVFYFLTQRDKRNQKDRRQGLSILALIKPELYEGNLRLTWNYREQIEIPSGRNTAKELPVIVWEHECLAVDKGDAIAEWLSDHLNLPVRLVEAAGSFERKARQTYMTNSNPMRFQDGYPVHWFPIESVNELSQIAGQDIPWQSFRPQIVVEGMTPQYEHKIHSGKIAGIKFVGPKPCGRCEIPRVDQETGELKVYDPRNSLATYKLWRNKEDKVDYIFGENMLPMGHGFVGVGDPLEVTAFREPPLIYGAKV